MTVQRQGTVADIDDGGDDGGIAENVAVHQQEVTAVGIGTGEPQREDIVVVLIIHVVDEVDGELRIGLREEVADHIGTVAGDNDEFTDAGGNHSVDGTLEERTLSHFEKTFRTFVRERPQPLGHSGRKNYS